ncbi:AIR synthase related protein [Geobacillus kaustophilus]|uniref:AIR synthase related protein n=1 Tax=Geobacillus kaustophilus TaxID=1462 RepID=UPI0005CDBF15|nr:AIR synthase related protein [Geobacillus kaustophilus]
MRDVLFLPFADGMELAIAADGSAAVGDKPADAVSAPVDVVAYFAVRVALMELLSIGAEAKAVVLQNFIADDRWEALCRGIRRACRELGIDLPITGSTESNFPTEQSALGVTAIGLVPAGRKRIGVTPDAAKFAVIGRPLVGPAVLAHSQWVAPLSLFVELLASPYIYELIPVGSKGIYYEWTQLLTANGRQWRSCACPLPLFASGGPATSVLVSYDPDGEREIKKQAGSLFFPLHVEW